MSTSTPTRKEAREHARAERRHREEEAALQAIRKRRLAWVGGLALAAVVAVAVVIAVASGGSEKTAAGGGGPSGVAAITAEFSGIPQKGNELGAADAKATMMIFADLQCPFCAEFEANALPGIVKRYVRTGKLKLVFLPISIVGPDSQTGAKATAAAAEQGKLFQYSSLFYRNQGTENTGYVDDAFITKIAEATPGLDVAKWKRDLASPDVGALLGRAQTASETANIGSTPSFLVGRTGQPLELFEASSLTAEAFHGKLDALTG